MKTKITLLLALIISFNITGCSFINELNNIVMQGKTLVYSVTIDDEEIEAFIDGEKDNLAFQRDNKWFGDLYEFCGFKKSNYYYYFDDASTLDVYHDGKLITPIEKVIWNTNTTSIYKFDESLEYIAYPKGTADFNKPIATAVLLFDGHETHPIDADIDTDKFYDLLSRSESYTPNNVRIAIDTGEEYSHKITIVQPELDFNKELITFYPTEITYSLSTTKPYTGILEEETFSFGLESKYKYYLLDTDLINEFDEITGYSRVVEENK